MQDYVNMKMKMKIILSRVLIIFSQYFELC